MIQNTDALSFEVPGRPMLSGYSYMGDDTVDPSFDFTTDTVNNPDYTETLSYPDNYSPTDLSWWNANASLLDVASQSPIGTDTWWADNAAALDAAADSPISVSGTVTAQQASALGLTQADANTLATLVKAGAQAAAIGNTSAAQAYAAQAQTLLAQSKVGTPTIPTTGGGSGISNWLNEQTLLAGTSNLTVLAASAAVVTLGAALLSSGGTRRRR